MGLPFFVIDCVDPGVRAIGVDDDMSMPEAVPGRVAGNGDEDGGLIPAHPALRVLGGLAYADAEGVFQPGCAGWRRC